MGTKQQVRSWLLRSCQRPRGSGRNRRACGGAKILEVDGSHSGTVMCGLQL